MRSWFRLNEQIKLNFPKTHLSNSSLPQSEFYSGGKNSISASFFPCWRGQQWLSAKHYIFTYTEHTSKTSGGVLLLDISNVLPVLIMVTDMLGERRLHKQSLSNYTGQFTSARVSDLRCPGFVQQI